ncbi:hypothetical protein PsorP6_002076 [Peronosclerospora sorghi]|uniref:Uncharacterized protein n=1 Tax=Peronosclerospora sorghi TaxID=230839 RepID=A0ACC0WZ39_9STRA|nr:hypothetical protein PsorP6_002076 [Peronosclerospora sorghi]
MTTTPLALDAPVPSEEYDRMMDTSDNEGLYKVLRQIVEHVFVVIRNSPYVPGESKTTCGAHCFHIALYGEVFDVVTEPNPVNIAFTTAFLKIHIDLEYYEFPLGFQLLHSLRFDESVKGAEEFRRLYLEHFMTFCRVPATFKKHHLRRKNPIILEYQRAHIQLNHRDEVVAVHWSPSFEGPLRVPFDAFIPYYDVYRLFHELVEGGKHR